MTLQYDKKTQERITSCYSMVKVHRSMLAEVNVQRSKSAEVKVQVWEEGCHSRVHSTDNVIHSITQHPEQITVVMGCAMTSARS